MNRVVYYAKKRKKEERMYTFLRFPEFKRKAVTLSYDDGTPDDKRLVEIIDKYGIKCTFNINSELFPEVCGKGYRLPKDEVYELLATSCHEVAVHGAKHLCLTEVDKAMATRDVIADRENLEKIFDRMVQGMAYANGATSDDVVQILKDCGIHYARTTVSTEKFDVPTDWLRMPTTCHHKNPRLMELAKQFVEAGEHWYHWANRAMLFSLWGHSVEFSQDDNWHILEEFCSYVGNREDIWYATNGEVYDYVQAYNRLEFSVDGNRIYNPTNTDVYLYYFSQNILVPKGQTVVVTR